jgi:hypothetical protein
MRASGLIPPEGSEDTLPEFAGRRMMNRMNKERCALPVRAVLFFMGSPRAIICGIIRFLVTDRREDAGALSIKY